MLEELCTIKDACFTEKAGRTTIYKRIKDGHYKSYKIGGSRRISVASIKKYRNFVKVAEETQTRGSVEGEIHAD